jgi:hypothetical protein
MPSDELKPNPKIANLAYQYVPAALAALHEIITSKSASASARVSAAHLLLTYARTATGYVDFEKFTDDELRTMDDILRRHQTDEFGP